MPVDLDPEHRSDDHHSDPVVEQLRRHAPQPTRGPDIAAIRSRARRRARTRRALGTTAAIVVLAGLIAATVALTGADHNHEAVTAAGTGQEPQQAPTTSPATEPATPTEPDNPQQPEQQAPEQAPENPTPPPQDHTPQEPPPAGTAPPAPPEPEPAPAPSYDFTVALPVDLWQGYRPDAAAFYDVVLVSDPHREGGCVWAQDIATGALYSVAWDPGSTARFIAHNGQEHPTEIRDPNGHTIAHTGTPLRVTSYVVAGPVDKCALSEHVITADGEWIEQL